MTIVKKGICTIKKLNHDGLGVSDDPDIALPYVLSGEEVEFELHEYRAKKNSILSRIVKPSAKRQKPDCRYFGSCGGCLLQHMDRESYVEFKHKILQDILNVKSDISEVVVIGPNVRRRCVFEVVKKDDQIFLGFHRFHSHQIVNIDSCPLVLPEISSFIPTLKLELLRRLPDRFKSKLFILKTIEGINWYVNDEICHWPKSHILIDDIPVEISHDSFLQTSEAADVVLQELVISEVLESSKKVLDLFCGRGTFTIPLARKFKVTGIDIEEKGIGILHDLATKHKLDLCAMTRDLFLSPIPNVQLKKFDFVVINPPRAGAAAQIKEIALSGIKKIVYVSCNPKTFASDFKILQKSGYKITKITPVDQFHWSPHLEIVAVLEYQSI